MVEYNGNLSFISLIRLDSLRLHSLITTELLSRYPFKMAFTTGNDDLSTPLLNNLPQHESDTFVYDEECCMPCSLRVNGDDDKEEESDGNSNQCTWWWDIVNLVVLEEEADDEDSDESSQSTLWCDNFFTLVVLPALLFSSFGEAFYLFSVDADTGLRWPMVNYTIVMFAIIATLYRRAVQDCKITSVALLLPEILAYMVLSLVLCGQVLPAFWLLLSSILCLAVFVVASSLGVLEASTMIDQSRL
jgi:hypothetical protein